LPEGSALLLFLSLSSVYKNRLFVLFDRREIILANADASEILAPYGKNGHHAVFFQTDHKLGESALALKLTKLFVWSEQGAEKSLFHRSLTGYPCAETVDRGIEIVETDHDLADGIVANDLLCDLAELIIENYDVVAVPAHAAGNVKGEIVIESEEGRDLVAYNLGGMIVSVIEQAADTAGSGGVWRELVGSCGGAVNADAEKLALYRGPDLRLGLCV